MVVHIVYKRRENSLRGGDTSVRFLGGAMSNSPGGKRLVRLASRAVAPASPSDRSGGLTLRATSPPPPSISIASNPTFWGSRKLHRDGEEDWVKVVAVGDKTVGPEDAAVDDSEGAAGVNGVVFEAPPTDDEVHAAIASIQQVFENPSGVDSDALALPISGLPPSGMFLNYFAEDSHASEKQIVHASEKQIVQLAKLGHSPSALAINSSALVTRGHQNVLDAFHILQEDSSVQKMVMALSTDKAVWNAVMNNEVVLDFKKSFQDAKETGLKGSSSSPGVMKWVLENTQGKIKEFLERIFNLVNTLFQAKGKDYDLSNDVVRMSFMLSVFIFIVVTIARIK